MDVKGENSTFFLDARLEDSGPDAGESSGVLVVGSEEKRKRGRVRELGEVAGGLRGRTSTVDMLSRRTGDQSQQVSIV